jgi:cell shape-determining protein MreC
VVGRTTRVSRRFLELDVGTDDGVVRDLPVCAGWSLAGMIAGVREGRCLVQELGDSESRIPATVMDGRKLIAEGVLVGTGVPGRARLDYIEPRDDLRIDPGMHVVTAGSDGRLPPGLVLGQIATAMRGSGAEHWRLDVTLAADASTAESLLVMRVPNAPAQPAPAPAADEATAAP